MAEGTIPLIGMDKLTRRSELPFAIGVLGLLAVMVLPIPVGILSVMLALNMSVAVLILLITIYSKEALEFSTFPTLILVTTLARLGLNVATTRQVLLTGDGGEVIEAFGTFVVGGNLVVGLVIFAILLVIQLVVITKGSGRISEVAARFTLDAMPGKQMAIDADLNAGLITEAEARKRREKISAEAEFYGAMDGASKFVKGDAIAGLIIVAINLVAGAIIGMTMLNMKLGDSINHFALLTVGDGLASAIPSLLISIASGMLVTKARSNENIGQELPRQIFLKPTAILIAACMSGVVSVVPGMPFIPFVVISVILFFLHGVVKRINEKQKVVDAEKKEQEEKKGHEEEKPEDLLGSDRLGVEIGYRLIPLVDKARGGTLLERITRLRKQLARERGLLVPPVRVKDNVQLEAGSYHIMVHGDVVGTGLLMPDRLLAIDGGGVRHPIEGIAAKEPAFGLDALWVDVSRRSEAEARGYTVTDPTSVFITHLTEVLKKYSSQILSREDVQAMLDRLKRESPVLAKELTENVKPGVIQKVLAVLLEEGIPLCNMEKILEGIADHPQGDAATIAESIRPRLGQALVQPHLDSDGRLTAIILHPITEQRLADSLVAPQKGGGIGISPAEAGRLMDQLGAARGNAATKGQDAVLLVTGHLRRHLRMVSSRFHPDLAVVSYNELPSGLPVEVVATISLEDQAAKK